MKAIEGTQNKILLCTTHFWMFFPLYYGMFNSALVIDGLTFTGHELAYLSELITNTKLKNVPEVEFDNSFDIAILENRFITAFTSIYEHKYNLKNGQLYTILRNTQYLSSNSFSLKKVLQMLTPVQRNMIEHPISHSLVPESLNIDRSTIGSSPTSIDEWLQFSKQQSQSNQFGHFYQIGSRLICIDKTNINNELPHSKMELYTRHPQYASDHGDIKESNIDNLIVDLGELHTFLQLFSHKDEIQGISKITWLMNTRFKSNEENFLKNQFIFYGQLLQQYSPFFTQIDLLFHKKDAALFKKNFLWIQIIKQLNNGIKELSPRQNAFGSIDGASYREFSEKLSVWLSGHPDTTEMDLIVDMRNILNGKLARPTFPGLSALTVAWFLSEVVRRPTSMMCGLMLLDLMTHRNDPAHEKHRDLYTWNRVLIHEYKYMKHRPQITDMYGDVVDLEKWDGMHPMAHGGSARKGGILVNTKLKVSQQKEAHILIDWLYYALKSRYPDLEIERKQEFYKLSDFDKSFVKLYNKPDGSRRSNLLYFIIKPILNDRMESFEDLLE